MAPLEGVVQIKGDITSLDTVYKIIAHFEGKLADLIISDGAPDVTGMHDIDEYIQAQLILAALNITTHLLRSGGTFIAKIFRGKDTTLLYSKLKILFPFVHIAKPKSSRNSSIEAFVVCRNYQPPANYTPTMVDPIKNATYGEDNPQLGANRLIVPFVAVGDLSGYDSDQTYPLQSTETELYHYRTAIQPPINPPYQESIKQKRNNTLKAQEAADKEHKSEEKEEFPDP